MPNNPSAKTKYSSFPAFACYSTLGYTQGYCSRQKRVAEHESGYGCDSQPGSRKKKSFTRVRDAITSGEGRRTAVGLRGKLKGYRSNAGHWYSKGQGGVVWHAIRRGWAVHAAWLETL